MAENIFGIGRRINKGNENHWIDINLEDFKMTKPLVLVIGGWGTENSEDANGYAKFVESLIGVFKNDVDLLSMFYNVDYNDEYDRYLVEKELLRKLFIPLISKDGEKIDAFDAAKNMRNITMFTHCYGDKIATELMFILKSNLELFGYDEEESQIILNQIFLMSYGIDSETPFCKKMCIISPYDDRFIYTDRAWVEILKNPDAAIMSERDIEEFDFIRSVCYFDDAYPMLREFYENHERCFVLQDYDRIYLATTALHNNDIKDHRLVEMSRQQNWMPHENASKTGDYVSRCMAAGLCYSIATSIKNISTGDLVPLNLTELRYSLEGIVEPLNSDSKKSLNFNSTLEK